MWVGKGRLMTAPFGGKDPNLGEINAGFAFVTGVVADGENRP
jgi:hypothetical protein